MSQLFQDDKFQDADRKELIARQREQRVNLKAFLLTIAIVMAPFLALLFGMEAALVVLAAGLGFTVWLAWMASATAGPAQRARLRMMAMLNVGLLTAVLVILGFLVFR
jgi:predicted nucleic acid-binding Zn ribbon protein